MTHPHVEAMEQALENRDDWDFYHHDQMFAEAETMNPVCSLRVIYEEEVLSVSVFAAPEGSDMQDLYAHSWYETVDEAADAITTFADAVADGTDPREFDF